MTLKETFGSWRESSITAKILIVLGSVGFLSAMRDLFPISIFVTYIILFLLTLIGGVVIFVLNWERPKDTRKWDGPRGGLDKFLAVVLWLVLLGALGYFVVSAYNANRCPEVNLSASSELMLDAGQSITLEAEVSDPEDDPLTCRWSAFYDDGSDASTNLSARPFPSRNCVTTYTAQRLGAGTWVEVSVEVDDGACGRKVTKSKRIRILPWQGPADTPTLTKTEVPTPTHTPTLTNTPLPILTDTPTLTNTPLPTFTDTPTPTLTLTPGVTLTAPTRTSVPEIPMVTSTITSTTSLTPLPAPTPSPTVRWLPAPVLLAPLDGTSFKGWNDEVILRWSEVGGMRVDEYYVVRIVYNERREQAEFWRQDASLKVPDYFSTNEFGFQDRHYEWSVQTMRCISNCRKALDDEYTKRGTAVGGTSKTGLFYWHTDTRGNGGGGTPTPTSIGEDPKD